MSVVLYFYSALYCTQFQFLSQDFTPCIQSYKLVTKSYRQRLNFCKLLLPTTISVLWISSMIIRFKWYWLSKYFFFFVAFQSRSVDKKHAVITILEEQGLHFIHDLDSLNGVSNFSCYKTDYFTIKSSSW